MLRPLPLLPALVAVVTALAPLPASAHAGDERPPRTSRTVHRSAPAPAGPADPLEVTITSLSPSYIPVKGPIRVTGSVTNTSEDTWRNNNVYAFIGHTPIRTRTALDAERERGTAQLVGDRITEPGAFDRIDDLAPGDSAQFSLKVPRASLGVTEEGVYWFGVHALGEGPEGRGLVPVADGRARTFLPLVSRTRRQLDTALVIPIRHDIAHADDGSIADADEWADALDDGGPLRTLVDFGASAGSRPVTWLVDPAVIDTVQALVDGNAARSLDDTDGQGSGGGPDESAEPEPSEGASESAAAEPAAEEQADEERRTTRLSSPPPPGWTAPGRR